jgi:hypothetical protein
VSTGRLEPFVTVTDAPDPAVEAAIGGGLNRFNEQQSGTTHSRPLAVVVSHPETKQVFGEIPGDPPGTSRIFMTKTLAL